MNIQFTENKLIKLFIEIDDLIIAFRNYQKTNGLLEEKTPTRRPVLNGSEVCTILVCYHYSGYKCFEYYYKNKILGELNDYCGVPHQLDQIKQFY